MVFFLIFFTIFLEFSIMHRVGTEWNDSFYFRSFSDFTNQKAWNEAIMVSFNFLNFVAIFLEFSITRRVGVEWKDNFYFLSFTAFLQSGLKWCHNGIFLIFLLFSWNFLLRIGDERSGTIIFIFSLSQPFQAYFGLKWSHNDIF